MPSSHHVSILIPVYNEALAIRELLDRVFKAPLPEGMTKEVVIVDDGSEDVTAGLIEEFEAEHPQFAKQLNLFRSFVNHGKGAALRAGFRIAAGDIILIQDGDLEYSPNDYGKLLAPFSDSNTSIVYGSRFSSGHPKGMKTLNLIANLILAWSTTFLYGQKITDEATGYKVFRKSVLENIDLQCRGFEFCPEFTGKALRAGFKITEVPISYNPRGILDGKKIKARDGFIAIWWLVKARFSAKRLPQNRANVFSK